MKQFCIYIMTNNSRTLYVGVTSNLERRVLQHKRKLIPGFTAKYNLDRLVYFETTRDARAAISREKQIQAWRRAKKITLIEAANPHWQDLSDGWHRTGE